MFQFHPITGNLLLKPKEFILGKNPKRKERKGRVIKKLKRLQGFEVND